MSLKPKDKTIPVYSSGEIAAKANNAIAILFKNLTKEQKNFAAKKIIENLQQYKTEK